MICFAFRQQISCTEIVKIMASYREPDCAQWLLNPNRYLDTRVYGTSLCDGDQFYFPKSWRHIIFGFIKISIGLEIKLKRVLWGDSILQQATAFYSCLKVASCGLHTYIFF